VTGAQEAIVKSVRAKAVIGAGYGDEGKGLVTDMLAATMPRSVVVRSNGGAQAGHTVVAPGGTRHVFHHIGSGALAGAPSHLSAHFVAHPMLLLDEWKQLADLGANVQISSDPRAIVTTPFDMMINQALEMARGTARHGSCGLGFGETVERNLRPEFTIRTRDLYRSDLTAKLRSIWRDWLPQRLQQLGLAALPESMTDSLDMECIIDRFAADCEAYLERVTLWPDSRIVEKGEVIFEGAQGLMIDQDYGVFPHVTRSNTGLKNMLTIAAEAGITELDAVYVTRCYATRHGAGPLAHETERLDGIAVYDPTNAPNDWQGTLRLAPLDTDTLREAIRHDLQFANAGISVNASLAVTCLDQAEGSFSVGVSDWIRRCVPEEAGNGIAGSVGLPLFGESWGPCRDTFRASQPQKLAA
jgi:adenylosuccinate synthase